jgi:hypothetical protein
MVEYHLSLTESDTMERYRSGHNEAVLKTVCPQGRVGSNPTLSVEPFGFTGKRFIFNIEQSYVSVILEKYPSWLKGLPWKGSRSLIAARGFKSLLLRSQLSEKQQEKSWKKLLTDGKNHGKIIELTEKNGQK